MPKKTRTHRPAFFAPIPAQAGRPWMGPKSRCAAATAVASVASSEQGRLQIRARDRIALLVQYRGTHFHGWAEQHALRTVCGTLAAAARAVASDGDVEVAGASRTDAGAHARGQVAVLSVARMFAEPRAWTRALNARLPGDVRVSRAAAALPGFDPRRSATWRRYVYSVRTAKDPDVFADEFVWRVYGRPLDIKAMHIAARTLVSPLPRDLSAFRKSGAPAAHTSIAVLDACVRRSGRDPEVVEIEVTANWFVYGMMRLLAAALVSVGVGDMSVEEFIGIVERGERVAIKTSAPASGLCLMQVGYPPSLDPFRGTRLVGGRAMHLSDIAK